MNKILIAFDSIRFSEGAFDFARQMNEQEPILLTGGFPGNTIGDSGLIPRHDKDDTKTANNIKRFESMCLMNGINFKAHKQRFDFALPELKKETIFSDLLIIGSEAFYGTPGKDYLQDSLRELLHISKCPVIVVPEKFKYPQTNILAYDGSNSSVFAIKQFSYLFPGLRGNKTILVYVKEDKGYEIPEEEYIAELAGRHFPDLTLIRLHDNRKRLFNEWLNNNKQPILVSGAFGRSTISQLFTKSFAYEVICEHKLPVFIAHGRYE
jgi:hypothetical protein